MAQKGSYRPRGFSKGLKVKVLEVGLDEVQIESPF